MLRELKGETLTKPEITSNSVLIVGGGAETTSTCLSATIYHLCKTPRVMQKLKDQIRTTFKTSDEITLRAIANLPYLKATIDESLRIFPVASYITPRVTPKGGHVIDGQIVPENVSDLRRQVQSGTGADDLHDRHPFPWASGTWADRHASSTRRASSVPRDGSQRTAAKRIELPSKTS